MTAAPKAVGRMTAAEIEEADRALASASAQQVVDWALERFGDRVAFASSFGAEDVALIHMLCAGGRTPRVFTLDTGRLHPETYEVMEKVRLRYGVTIEVHFPDREAVERLVRTRGLFSFRDSIENRKECCDIRKVQPLARALAGCDAWITGLRREQSPTRALVRKVELDNTQGGIAKINPLLDWTLPQVWAFIKEHAIPYNVLHDQGFLSIGCAPCTRAIKPYEDVRAGRWWWEQADSKECGLHVKR